MNDQQLLRYSRQIMLPDIDLDGQEKLLAARVLIIGLGGLGSPVAMYLAAAGVGNLLLADFDTVDLSNLQRQIAHTTDRIGQTKVESAAQTLRALNPDVQITCITQSLDADALKTLLAQTDVVVDCCDNFATRFAVNAACVAAKVPLVSGAAIRLEGQVSVFDNRQLDCPCYRCLYDEESEENTSCAANGVLSPLVGIIGSMQALETIKLIAGFGKTLAGKLLVFDARYSQWRELKLPKDKNCPVCGNAN
ncbi:molybdopterin-synthase adenylyltransferase MoeB [Cellvibrio zantedeschiae]|uniref:Molybdopterin-synthase adenylyltransferase MoeB n=1 Tax=Cellvibrio zantedeschiae TaxID=1237077 RepID=A0ABQ3B4T6_9GAMM|nr:molybdopterin-synthase adenylyltransferase MoeB [Cellvibrio zantedeschiae]GGY79908.1 molybdopterin-synthase adenylyltransferase MoeB [Cellvibrio zantedeschiae]